MSHREIIRRVLDARTERGFDALIGEWMVFARPKADPTVADAVARFCDDMERRLRERGSCR